MNSTGVIECQEPCNPDDVSAREPDNAAAVGPPGTAQHGATKPQSQPVVAAIVTSHLGVLVGKRKYGEPRWTFIAGEIEPGESPAHAGVREVKEETGLEVTAGKEIGRRVHPATGRTMIYVAAKPARGTDVFVGDADVLAEVRWVTLTEAEKLMQPYGMFSPVRDHLARTHDDVMRQRGSVRQFLRRHPWTVGACAGAVIGAFLFGRGSGIGQALLVAVLGIFAWPIFAGLLRLQKKRRHSPPDGRDRRSNPPTRM